MSETNNEDEITTRALKILTDALYGSSSPTADLARERGIMAASGWLNYTYAKRLDQINARMLKWNAAVAISSSAAATLALASLFMLLPGIR